MGCNRKGLAGRVSLVQEDPRQDHSGVEALVMRRIQKSAMSQVPGMGSAKALRQESR